MRPLLRALAWAGWGLLGVVAAVGVALAALAAVAALPATRPLVAARAVRLVDEAIAGKLELHGLAVLPQGGVELLGLEVQDPDGHLVLSVGRARVFVDLTGLSARAVGVTLELESPTVLVEEEPGGGISLLRAFAPAQPAGAAPGAAGERREGSRWTVHLSRVTVRGGEVWWVDARGGTRLEGSALDLDARGVLSARQSQLDLRLRGALAAPVPGPLALDVVGAVDGTAVRIPVLRAELGGAAIAALAEGDLERRRGRAAVTRLGLARDLARAFAPRVPDGDDLAASAYAESDGAVLTAALRAEPAGAERPGRADVAVAARLADPAGALGFDAALDRLDPSRLLAAAPSGEVTLAARGALAGRSLQELRGRVSATVQRSRLRRGVLARAEVVARADRGTLEVTRLGASAPGVELDAALRWRDGGEVSGRVAADAKDLSAALANAGALLGERLPTLDGRVRVEATLAGTSAAPSAAATIDAPTFRAGGLGLAGAHLEVSAAGPMARLSGRVEGRVASVRGGKGEVAHAVTLRGAVAEGSGSLSAVADLPGFRDPASITARGRLGEGRDTFVVSELAFSYPGERWTLAAPATVLIAGPSVDRLELAAGAQRIVLRGGLVRGRDLDARAELAQVDLARLPAGLLSAEHALRGTLGAEVSATGPPARPEVAATLSLADGAVDEVDGLSLSGTARWSGGDRRLRAGLAAARRAGGAAELDVDVPLPLAGRPAERIVVRARAHEVPLDEVLAAAGGDAPVAGLLGLDAGLEGTVGAPSLGLTASLAQGEWQELDGISLDVAAEDPGERLRLSVRAGLGGSPAATLDLEVPLDLADLLARPEAAAQALRQAALEGSLAVRAFDLARVSGRAGVPAGLAGTLEAAASFSGTVAAPRAKAAVDLRGGAWAGYRELSGHVDVVLGAASVSAEGRLAAAGDEAARFRASLGIPVEKLGAPGPLRAAPLRVGVTLPRVSLARAASRDVPLGGVLEGELSAAGTLRAPEITVRLGGEALAVEGRPLGSARLDARYASARATGEVVLAAAGGGTLRATFGVGHDLGLGAGAGPLGEAPAELTARAEALDLGFVAALAPGVVRQSAGKLALDVHAQGPLGRLSPRGTVTVTDGRLAVSEWGDFGGIGLDAAVTDDAVELSRLELRRGKGRLSANGSLRGLRAERAALEAHLRTEGLTLARAGMDIATLDLRADATGGLEGSALAMEVRIPRGVVRLPARTPRELQALDARKDIQVGRRPERKRRPRGPAGPDAAGERPFTVRATVRADRELWVKSDDPKVDIELRANVTYERTGDEDYAEGSVEVVRGSVEPIGGRTFVVERGRVQFTGGPPSAATLDVVAKYDNPAAVVTVTIEGAAKSPKIHFTSEPRMDEAEIAMLIATGRTDLKAGGGSVATLSGEEAGKAALGALATRAFKDLVADKLPVDSLSIDAGGFRAGTYVGKFYVIYQRRFEADPVRGENSDEVRVEYQITPRWMFESRYGNANAGGANLVWSKEY